MEGMRREQKSTGFCFDAVLLYFHSKPSKGCSARLAWKAACSGVSYLLFLYFLPLMNPAAIQKTYRFYAPFYDFVFGKVMDPGRKKVIEKIKQEEGMKILDVGVGTGLSIPYYESFVTVTGIDISKEMLDKARKSYPSDRFPCVGGFIEMDAQNLKFSDDAFDVAVVEYVASVVPDPEKMMREVSRVCQAGADIFVLNHFASEKGPFRVAERILAPFSQRLGFRTNLSLPEFLDVSALELVEILPVNLGGYWTLIHFQNTPAKNTP